MTQSLQISSKLPDGRIFVVGGDNVDSFEQNLKAIVGAEVANDILGEMATSLAGGGNTATAIANLNAGGLATTVDHTAHPTQGAQLAPANRTCSHGVMTRRSGQGAKGPWKGYMCPSPKGTPDQCEPVFIRRNDPEWNTF